MNKEKQISNFYGGQSALRCCAGLLQKGQAYLKICLPDGALNRRRLQRSPSKYVVC